MSLEKVFSIYALLSVLVMCEQIGFKRVLLCHLQERITLNLVRVADDVSSKPLECSRACMHEDTCFGFSYATDNVSSPFSKPGVCYLYMEYVTHEKCDVSNAQTNHVFYEKYGACFGGGSWDNTRQRCKCVMTETIFVGRFCATRPRNCRDLALAGFIPYTSEVKLTPIQNAEEISVKCEILDDGRSITQIGYARLITIQMGLNNTWPEYENGFGSLRSNFLYWIGIKYIKAMLLTTDRPSNLSLVISLQRAKKVIGEISALGAQLSNASDGYRLTYNDVERTGYFAGKDSYCFRDSNGVRFSTYDADHDEDVSENCAALNGAGWWFKSCHTPCNVFGLRYRYNFFTKKAKEPFSLKMVRIPDLTTKELAFDLAVRQMEIRS